MGIPALYGGYNMFGATHIQGKTMSKSNLLIFSIAVATMHGRGLVSRFFNQPYEENSRPEYPNPRSYVSKLSFQHFAQPVN